MKAIFVFLILLLGFYLIFFINSHQKGIPSHQQKPLVKLVRVKEMSIGTKVTAIGVLKPWQQVRLSAPISGMVKKIYFQSGQLVKKGDLLLELSNEDLKSKLSEDLEKYHFNARQYRRYEKLFKSGAIARADIERLSSSLIQEKAIYEYDEALLNKTFIRAPFSGKLGINQINVGQYLPSGTPIASLYDLSRVFVDFSVSQNVIRFIRAGGIVKISTQKKPSNFYFGKIAASEPRLSEESKSQEVRAEVNADFKDLGLLPGMFVTVEVLLKQNKAALFIPDTAILYSEKGAFVYVFHAGLVRRQKVLLGDNKDGWVQIKEGLHQSERVVVSNTDKLFDDKAVEINND